ncbi:protein kinase [Aggregicoccus sp. 17bor-14]|uniref:serine/threonine protein kinase n=1 Tax=Myxococcaceae TaxID=31 RepID=UPI00129C58D9|nr:MULTISPECIES: serine/threonine-protein kinase [Myxococcaceae]MBF5042207.1 serine/threonine protein kinase [Simulacricoccus sp. 17bor-14]MRI87983.1 protein kinase [Aggregicoccus sp. 17bor-14]
MIERNTIPKLAPTEVGDPLIGRVLNDRFRIIEVLGSGGMGRVYKAMQAPLDRLVALKVLNASYAGSTDPGFQKRFFLEASVTSKLRHPNTITVIDYGKTDDGIFFIAMEYLEGKTLAQVLTQLGPQPWGRALSIGMQIARSLREAHKVGLIHRDLKPANVMVINQEEADTDLIKVLDFGLVKSFTPDAAVKTPSDTELTQNGVILGSPQYMAPEQARNISDPRSDVYSLGVLLYQTLTGRPPFQAAQSIDVIIKHLNEPPPPFSSVWPNHAIPQEVEALVMKCLEKRPDQRFQSMEEVLEGMKRASTSAGMSGAFNTSPQMIGSGPLQVNTGALRVSSTAASRLSQTGAQRLQQAAAAAQGGTGAHTLALDVSLDDEAPKRKLLPLALFGGAALLGVGAAALFFLRSPAPAPAAPAPVAQAAAAPATQPAAPAPQQPAVAAAAQPASTEPVQPAKPVKPEVVPVRFLVASEPSGARVLYRGRSLGETPVQLEVEPGARGRAEAELTFVLSGYERTVATAEGRGPEVRFTQKLKKKNEAKPKPGSPGYKDDPYQ